MKYKIFLLAAVFALLCSYSAYAYDKAQSADEFAKRTVLGLGITDDSDSESYVTRGEFASIMCNMCRIETSNTQWQRDFFGDTDSEMSHKEDTLSYGEGFEDVKASNEYYRDINAVVSYGIMNGVSKSEFDPEREITFDEALKTLVKISGHSPQAEINGGYPSGYIYTANSLGITKGVNVKSGEKIKLKDLQIIIYNTFDVKVLEKTITGDRVSFEESNETVLSYVMNMNKASGIMTANRVTNMYGAANGNTITVGDVSMTAEDDKKYLNEFIAHKVTAYYDIEDNEVLWADISLNDYSYLIDAKNINGFNDGTLKYTENNRNKELVIKSGTPVIYNGTAVSEISESMFDMQSGSVEIIKNDSACDAVIIYNFKTFVVSGIDKENDIIYNKSASNTDDEKINIGEDSNVTLQKDGEYTDKNAIKDGDVLSVAKGKNAVYIKICDKTVSGEISSADDEYIYINSKPYTVSRQYINSRAYIPLTPGSSLTVYLDSDGNIAWADIKSAENIGGYLIKCYDDFGINRVKIFTLAGKNETYTLADRLAVNSSDNDTKYVKGDAQRESLQSGYINYSLDKDMKVSKIVYPVKNKPVEKRLFTMIDNSMNNMVYKEGTRGFSGKAYIGNTTKVINLKNENDALKLAIGDYSVFKNDTAYKIEAYGTNPDSSYADVIIYSDNSQSVISERDYVGVVENIVLGVNSDNELVKRVIVHQNGKQIELTAREENGKTVFDRANNPIDSSSETSIKKGDIIRWSNDADGYTDNVSLVYSPYIQAPSGSEGYLAGVTNDKYMVAAEFIDRAKNENNIYNVMSNSQTKTNCNPYAVNNGSLIGMAFKFGQYNIRTMLAWAYSKNDSFITITTQDLSDGEEFSANGIPETEYTDGDMTGVYIVDSVKYERFAVTYVKYGKGNSAYIPQVRTGTLSDIKTYKDYGTKCSKVLCMLRSGEPHQLVIIDNE